MSLSPLSLVEFNKLPCRPVNFRGQGPNISLKIFFNLFGGQYIDARLQGQSIIKFTILYIMSLKKTISQYAQIECGVSNVLSIRAGGAHAQSMAKLASGQGRNWRENVSGRS